eukprot:scaffold5391_cov121-Isochrysis_galbana.AAC.5
MAFGAQACTWLCPMPLRVPCPCLFRRRRLSSSTKLMQWAPKGTLGLAGKPAKCALCRSNITAKDQRASGCSGAPGKSGIGS